MGRLDGKVAVITGVAGGIGGESARLFAAEGATVVGVDLGRGGGCDLDVQADVTDAEQVAGAYARAREAFGRIDVLFNNAGISPPDDASVLDTSLEAWRRVQDVNLTSRLPVLQARHPAPARQRGPAARLGHQHGVVRGRHGRGHVADLLHGLQGRRARHVARARRRVRAPRRARQRAVPRAGRHAAAARAVRQGPRAGASAGSCTCPWAASRRRARSPTPRCSWPRDESSYVTASTFLVDGGISGAYVTPE